MHLTINSILRFSIVWHAAKMLSRSEILAPLLATRFGFHSSLEGAFGPLGGCKLSATQPVNIF